MKGTKMTEDKIEYLQKNYTKFTIFEIARYLGVSYRTIENWKEKLGLTHKRGELKLNDKEINYIRDNYLEKTDNELAKVLNVSPQTIRIYRDRMNLRKEVLRGKGARMALVESDKAENIKRLQMLEMLKVRERSIGEISRELNRSKEQIIKFRDELVEQGYAVKYDEERHQFILVKEPERFFKSLDMKPFYKNHFKFGIISDTQIGSKYMQASLLYTAYDLGDKEGIEAMFHSGDFFDGISMYKGQHQEIFAHGADDQLDWAVKNYPRLKGGRKTYVISGSHDLSFKKIAGYNILRMLANLRKDIVYRGDISTQFDAHKLQVEMVHPSGGMAYALSYRAQRRAESILGDLIARIRITRDIDSLPNISIMGHLHQMFWFGRAGIEYFSAPCLQSQTPYLQAKGYAPELGMFIVDVYFDKNKNVIDVRPQKKKWDHLIRKNDY